MTIDIVNNILEYLKIIDEFLWSYIAFSIICLIGLYLTFISKGFQFKVLGQFKSTIKDLFEESKKNEIGISPIKLFFTSAGGSIGMGNIIGIGTAVMIGGLGSIFWMWIASFFGMLIKYSEIYLAIKHRTPNSKGGYNGGLMYYCKIAFKSKIPAYISAILLCFYGAEVYLFLVLVDRLDQSINLDRWIIIAMLLITVMYSVLGGIKRISNICSIMMPIFIIGYSGICLYIIISNYACLPSIFIQIFTTAFTGQAKIGGFIGSTWLLSAYLGMSKAVYSGDIGIGYDSIVQSESKIVNPKKQAKFAIYALFTDTLLCFMTSLVIAVTGAWYTLNHLAPSNVMSHILSGYFSLAEETMTILLLVAGFTTVIAYLLVGIKSAEFINKKLGKYVYIIYSIIAFIVFSYLDQENVITFMSIAGGLLIVLNIITIIKLRKEIEF